jgi:hypothetical protein
VEYDTFSKRITQAMNSNNGESIPNADLDQLARKVENSLTRDKQIGKAIVDINNPSLLQKFFGLGKKEHERRANGFGGLVLTKTMASINEEGKHLSDEHKEKLTELVEKSVLKWGDNMLKKDKIAERTALRTALQPALQNALRDYAFERAIESQKVQFSGASVANRSASLAQHAVEAFRRSPSPSEQSQGAGRSIGHR